MGRRGMTAFDHVVAAFNAADSGVQIRKGDTYMTRTTFADSGGADYSLQLALHDYPVLTVTDNVAVERRVIVPRDSTIPVPVRGEVHRPVWGVTKGW